MPKVEQIICDVCGAVKGEANRWWVILAWIDHLQLMPLEGAMFASYSGSPTTYYLCGQSCVVSVMSGFMQTSENLEANRGENDETEG